jgi:hypothetical protein
MRGPQNVKYDTIGYKTHIRKFPGDSDIKKVATETLSYKLCNMLVDVQFLWIK